MKFLIVILALFLSVFDAKPAAELTQANRPNIVFILADDLGINDLRCYGRKDHATPHLDRLASEGARFTSAYCAQPICSPSRAAILTGKTPARLHLTTYLPGRPDCPSQKVLHPKIRMEVGLEEKTLAEHLREAGYATACIGKWHVGGAGFGPKEQGFDFYHPGKAVTVPSDVEGGKGEYDLTSAAERFIEAHKTDPFFVYLAHNTPHIPFNAKTNLVLKNSNAHEPVYAAVIETMDDTVGRLMGTLDRLNLRQNTIVIFTSDNGGLHVPEGTHRRITHNTPYRAGKGYLYEGGLRIPLILRWPGKIIAGQTIDEPMINTDWLPTLLGMAGLPIPTGLDGMNLSLFLTGSAPVPTRQFFWHFPHYNNQGGRPGGAVREGDWKLIEYYDTYEVQLFNLSQDIGESRNLIHEKSVLAVAERMRKKLAAWKSEIKAQDNSPNPECNPLLFEQLYVKTDASRFNSSQANALQQEQILEWRKGMNSVLSQAKKQ